MFLLHGAATDLHDQPLTCLKTVAILPRQKPSTVSTTQATPKSYALRHGSSSINSTIAHAILPGSHTLLHRFSSIDLSTTEATPTNTHAPPHRSLSDRCDHCRDHPAQSHAPPHSFSSINSTVASKGCSTRTSAVVSSESAIAHKATSATAPQHAIHGHLPRSNRYLNRKCKSRTTLGATGGTVGRIDG